jgi:hypothetical protein
VNILKERKAYSAVSLVKTLEGDHHHFNCILLIGCMSLSPAHTQEEENWDSSFIYRLVKDLWIY